MPDIPDHLIRLKGGFKAFLSHPRKGFLGSQWGAGIRYAEEHLEAASAALAAGDTHYTRGEGREELCTAWASHLPSRWKIPVEDEGIIVTQGPNRHFFMHSWSLFKKMMR
ncbi:MAG: hypothetical protein Ct9H90mP16_16890 [Candidatus Poseidoniales archaeon]|nr:MAG: hypothetical protein Ct9H90mP16_16890 [Candidatus Poseidoniales archaeon]